MSSSSSTFNNFLDTPYKVVKEPVTAGELAWQNGYAKPLRYKVTIKDAYEDETLVSYDSWDQNRQIGVSLQDVGVTQGMNIAGF